MLRNTVLVVRQCKNAVNLTVKRNIGLTAVVNKTAAQLDPIQQLFVDKIREYKTKSAGGKLVDATPELEKQLQDQLEKVARGFGAAGLDFTQFPTYNYQDPELEDVGGNVPFTEERSAPEIVSEIVGDDEDDDTFIYP